MSHRLSSVVFAFCLSCIIPFSPVKAADSAVSTALDDAKNLSFNFGSESSLKIAPPAQLCAADTEGAIRYNKAAKKMEWCDGTSWSPFSQPKRTWVSYTGTSARIPLKEYTNDTDHDIEVSVQFYSGASGSTCSSAIGLKDGTGLSYQFVNHSLGAAMCDARATIPPGATYIISGLESLYGWAELR